METNNNTPAVIDPYAIFAIDTTAECVEGIIAQYPVKGSENRSFRVRFVHSGDSNVHYREFLRALLKPMSFRIQQEMVEDEEYEDILIRAFAEKIIKSWQSQDGVDAQGNPIYVDGIYGDNFVILPFEKQNVIELFKKARRLFRDIKKQSDNFATFRKIVADEAIKN